MKNNPQKKILRQDGFPIGAEMAKKRYSSAGTTTPFLKQLILTILLFAILPITALAVEGAPNSLYVGNQRVISSSDNITYWTTDADGNLTQSAADQSWNVKYDPSTATLTLNSATIKGDNSATVVPFGAGIYALCSNNQPVALTIELIGTNTITGLYGIFLNAEISASSYGTDASLTITGENNGSLEVSGSSHGIYVKSGTGNASLNIKNVAVTSSTNGNYAAGVYVMSGSSATNSPNISLSVDGGSLTASGTGSSDGIQFYVGDSNATNATTSLTVTDHAIVDARTGGIRASRISETLPTPTPTGGNSSGIVFDGTEGTVYGDVTLQENLEIGEGESLTIPEGTTLTIPQGMTLTNYGTLTSYGTVINQGTLDGNGTITCQHHTGGTATCTQRAKCSLCGTEYGDLAPHTLTKTEAQAPTCTQDGNIDYWTCSVCNKLFRDEAGTQVITEEDTKRPALGHDWGEPVYTWSEDNTACTAKLVCLHDSEHSQTATATVTSEPTKDPTCTEMGETTYTAEFDEDWASQQTKTIADIDATGHGETKIQNAKEPTCTADGYTGDKVCVVCDDVVEYGTVIPATGHDYENGYCTICGKKDPDYVEPEPEPEPTYYRVDLRPVEGATVILSADEVEEGGTLTFTIEIAEGYVADDLMVTVSQGIGKAVEVKPDEAGVYTVKEVDGLVTITVYGVTEEPATAIERVETLRIYATGDLLHVETPTRQRVTIVSMAGALIADGEQEGARIYRDLNAGVYIVRVGDYATKVRVE